MATELATYSLSNEIKRSIRNGATDPYGIAKPYRAVYDAAKLKYTDIGLKDGHRHNRAMRAVMKEIVKDIWIHSR